MSKLRWTDFPSEIQTMILNEVLDQVSLGTYATVSHEWREFFESTTFRRLELSTFFDLENFHEMVMRRKAKEPGYPILTRHIWLRLELLPYGPRHDCGRLSCRQPEPWEVGENNDATFTYSVRQLFHTLSLISKANTRGQSITLEFSASSPSDSKHWFNSWYQLRPDYRHKEDMRTQWEYIRSWNSRWSDSDRFRRENNLLQHGPNDWTTRCAWAQSLVGPHHDSARQGSAMRLVRPLKFTNRNVTLPEVNIVSEFLIRRQYFRDVSTRSLRKLVRGLPELRSLCRENWRLISDKERPMDDGCYAARTRRTNNDKGLVARPNITRHSLYSLIPALPTRLVHLQLFEDFEMQLHGRQDVEQPRISRIELLPSLSVSTPYLETLAVGFLTDAIDAFGLREFYLDENGVPDGATYHFPHLEQIILTSQEHLRSDQDHHKINALLRAAATVALKMPKLKTMELWNWAYPRQACVFRYDITEVSPEHFCHVTWRSNWNRDFVIQPDVIAAWEKVALVHHPQMCSVYTKPVCFANIPLPTGDGEHVYLTYGSVLEFLKLRHILLHPVSAMQAELESTPTTGRLIWYS